MPKVNKLLEQAHEFFAARRYDKAIFLYSQVSAKEPKNVEYQLYALFCDLATENEEQAQELFDYFIIQKELDLDVAIEYVKDTIEAFDGNNELMLKLLNEITNQSIDSLDAIEYNDFLALVNSRGSFREAYEDIMFSTKVAITSKEELIDFINKLIENNFDTTAYSYLDGYGNIFAYDKDVVELYEKLEKNSLENKHQ
jgi:tetratricopeptide (TPR) repeat protein